MINYINVYYVIFYGYVNVLYMKGKICSVLYYSFEKYYMKNYKHQSYQDEKIYSVTKGDRRAIHSILQGLP
jgi:hypothetical protein